MVSERTISLVETETAFEKRRGVSAVDIRDGYAQVHVTGLAEPIMAHRLRVLATVRDLGINIDFLKLTKDGLSFLVKEADAPKVGDSLRQLRVSHELAEGRSILLIHAVNMRDEEGLLAQIVATAIASGAKLDHLGDMHDRLLIVTSSADAIRLSDHFSHELAEGARA